MLFLKLLTGWRHGPKIDRAICGNVNKCHPGSQVLAQMIRLDLVQCVVGCMVQIEIPAGILIQIDCRQLRSRQGFEHQVLQTQRFHCFLPNAER